MHSGQLIELIDILRQIGQTSPYGNKTSEWELICRTRARIQRKWSGAESDTGEVLHGMTATMECHHYVASRVQMYDQISTTQGRWRIVGIDTDELGTKTILLAEQIIP